MNIAKAKTDWALSAHPPGSKQARPLAPLAALGLGLFALGFLVGDEHPSLLALAAVGASMLVSAAVIWGTRRIARRRLDRDICIFRDLYASSATGTALVHDRSGRILWINAAAQSLFDPSLHSYTTDILAGISADPATLATRLHERASADGTASHTVPMDHGDWKLVVRPVGQGHMLWRISDTPHSDPRDELPVDMIDCAQDGRLRYLSPRLRPKTGIAPRHVADLLELPMPESGTLAHFTKRGSGTHHIGLRMPATPDGETIILLPTKTAPPDTGDSFSALQVLPVALGLIDRDGRLIRINDETRRLLRLRKDDTPRFADVLEGLGRPVGEWLADIRAGRVTNPTEVLRAVNPADDLFLQVSLRPYGGDGELLAIMNDATEFKALEAKFTQSQKMQAIGQLAGGVAHDFNNLLTAISGHCDLILLRHDRSDTDYPDLMQIQQNTNRAAALVRQLLAFSRKQTLQFETLDLHDLLADTIHLLNRLVGERVTLSLRHGEDMPLIRSDKRQFEQVLMNLVVNARDAMPLGGEIVIETEHCSLPGGLRRDKATLPPGDYAVIRVRDEGVGMPPATMAKVFDPFFSTKRQGEGTGLGLSTVYGIIKQSGGFIFVDSEEGQGTTFSIYFAAQAAPLVATQKPARPNATPATAERSTILLVEDEAPVRSFAARALQLQGHRVLEADSGEAALELLGDPTLRPDVFVTDVIMPGLDGPGWVAEIRDRFPDTPIVFMSGYAEDSRIAAQARFGKAVFIGKPFSLAQFTAIVHEQLRKVSEAA
ncbi:Sensor kinase CckA [Roseibaca ekhonensis]|uniref:histidine kinase n=1 Tax=Roseinatronobacter ekhonensis TaxID=254356 RepID=A0A3B0MK98_9RHOB|nr:ATP-binding protein [Roseibaca ekhonensis]SUZ31497.1 Sensor kinase CckA [Roseibaca ekhonensis]